LRSRDTDFDFEFAQRHPTWQALSSRTASSSSTTFLRVADGGGTEPAVEPSIPLDQFITGDTVFTGSLGNHPAHLHRLSTLAGGPRQRRASRSRLPPPCSSPASPTLWLGRAPAARAALPLG